MKLLIGFLTVLAGGMAFLANTQAARSEGKPDALKRSQQILAEEQRQHYVGQNLDSVSKQFLDLIDDMNSNGLIEAAQARDLKKTEGVLQSVGNKHVQKATEELRLARK